MCCVTNVWPLCVNCLISSSQDGKGEIHYAIDPASDPGRQFAVDGGGRVWLRRLLDRETAASHKVRVWAVDGGTPARTATATLLLPVQDVNDNPPHVAGPSALHVPENSWPRHVANVTLGDADDWTLGHGPPFTVVLDTSTSDSIREDFAVDFDSSKSMHVEITNSPVPEYRK